MVIPAEPITLLIWVLILVIIVLLVLKILDRL
jgi:hypothetical protein